MARDSASLIRDIQSTLRGWKEFDLTKKKGELEEAGIEISDAREKSSTSRKHLSSMTRDFKKLPEDEKIKGFGPVIKAYQAEIDNITKRAKHAEGAFLPLYASLYEASDPAPVLERAVEELSKTSTLVTQLAEVEDLNKKLVKEIEDYKKDFTTIRSQAPIIRKLEEKIKAMEVEMDAKIAKEVAASKSEAKKEESARKDEYLEREEGLKRELMKERELCKEMGQRVDRLQSELMEAKSQLETSGGDASTQIELLSEEVTRLQAREITLEKERDDLQRQYLDLWKKTKNEEGQGKEKGEAQQRERNALVESLRETVQNLEHDNKRLRIAMERAEEDAREQRADHADAVQRAMHNTHALSVEVEKVKSELAKRPAKDEYDRVCDELRSLKALHFNEYDGASRGGDVAAFTEQSLESLLAEKNRTLEAAVAKAKEASSRLEREKDELKEKIDALQREVEKKAELIEQLEKDVELVAAKRHASGLEELLEGMEGVEEEEEGEGQKREGENGEVSMLKIICHQRDRFKQRVDVS
mmetsp:Transcript_37897/g.97829  ORF Transcript_37897/g.97829 Transcript_37897/m.97829 type:complete len:530 (-) Transcript_37897:770-2359(-)